MRGTWKWIERRIQESGWRSDPALVLLVLWGLFIVYATLLPFDFSASGDLMIRRLGRIWAHPLKGGSWLDVQGNVLLFVPWGFLLAIWLARRRAGLIKTVAIAMCTGAILSGSVELFQLFAPSRNTSFIDLVTNSFGATVGALLGWPWIRLVWPGGSIRARQLISARPFGACALTTIAALMLAGMSPFGLALRASQVKAAMKAAQLAPFGLPAAGLLRSTKPGNWAAELLTWTLAGGVFALAARESRQRGARAIGWAAAVAVLLSLAIETLQLVVPARDVDITSVVLALLGSIAGALVVECFGTPEPRRLIIPALVCWGLAVVLTAWNPPDFNWPTHPYYRPERLVPFWSYFDSRNLADLADVIVQALLFMPLGALLAARTHRQSFAGVVVIGFLIGVLVEFGQAFLPRTVDISDALSAGAGAALGLALWRWGEWNRTSSTGAARYRIGRT